MKNGQMAEATIGDSTMCKMVIQPGENTVFTFLSNTQVTKFSMVAHYFFGLWWKSYFTCLVVAVYFDAHAASNFWRISFISGFKNCGGINVVTLSCVIIVLF